MLHRSLPLLCLILSNALISACGGGDAKSNSSQVAATVNGADITVPQINHLLQKQSGLRPEQMEGAQRTALDRLVTQSLAAQKAKTLELDRQPAVVQALDAAQREVLARAYLDQVTESTPKPSAAEIAAFFSQQPALFKDRKVYTLFEINVEAQAAQREYVETSLKASPTSGDFLKALEKVKLRHTAQSVTRAAEAIPMATLKDLSPLKTGQALLTTQPGGFKALIIQDQRPEPVDLAKARPAIEAFMLNERKRTAVDAALKTLRDSAKIEYLGSFAAGGSSPAAGPIAVETVGASAPAAMASAPSKP